MAEDTKDLKERLANVLVYLFGLFSWGFIWFVFLGIYLVCFLLSSESVA